METGLLLVFNGNTSQAEGANIWEFIAAIPGFPPVVAARFEKPYLSKDGTVDAFVNRFTFGGLGGQEDLSMVEPIPWEFHFPYPNDVALPGGDPDWLPDGFFSYGFSTIEGAISEWPDVDLSMVL